MKNSNFLTLLLLFILPLFLFSTIFTNAKNEEISLGDAANNVSPMLYVGTDDLGRTLPTNVSKATNHYRAVGMFYWPWHLELNSYGPYNVNSIMEANPTRKNDYEWWKNNYNTGYYWWNESIYGYYKENDDYVLRKQAELLADAGVDFVVFDCTNGTYTWDSAYENILKVWKEAKDKGVSVPQVAFMFHFAYSNNTYTSFMKVYNNLYNENSNIYKKYSSLIYKFNGKPLLLIHDEGAPNDIKELLKKFEVRKVDASYFIDGAITNGRWGWLSVYPQAYYKKANGDPEQISVGTAQNANYSTQKITAMNGTSVMGRSYAKGTYSYSYSYRGSTIKVDSSITGSTAKSKDTSLYGRNFQQQWDRAILIDPEIVFVTGWNEWIMMRFEDWSGVKNAFVDQFNDEYSRDIEPSKGKLKDNYYYQLVSNIRKYKGVSTQKNQKSPITINNTSDWNNKNILTYSHYVGGNNRNISGFGGVKYTNNTFRNDIKTAKVSYDSSYIYFYVETVKNISSYTSDKWMRLLIDTKASSKNTSDNWEEFEYIVNRNKGTATTLTLEKSTGGWKFKNVGSVSYRLNGKILEIIIPREYLGLTGTNIDFNFKWCDNNLENGDIMTLYTDGDAAPGGRFAFHFVGAAAYKKTITGDVNGDGKITSIDYMMIKSYKLGKRKLDDNQIKRGDTNMDGEITSTDYVNIKKKILGSKT